MLDGKKTYIGIGIALFGSFAGSKHWIDYMTSQLVVDCGLALAGIGIAHKMEKSSRAAEKAAKAVKRLADDERYER